jgi:hypothetical protein
VVLVGVLAKMGGRTTGVGVQAGNRLGGVGTCTRPPKKNPHIYWQWDKASGMTRLTGQPRDTVEG